MIYATLKTLHVLAIVVWVGGMVFAHFFLRPAVAQLAGPDAELMTTVDAGQRPHARPQRIAAEDIERAGLLPPVRCPTQGLSAGLAACHPVRGGGRAGRQLGKKAVPERGNALRPGGRRGNFGRCFGSRQTGVGKHRGSVTRVTLPLVLRG